jgi:hypothetical protein
MGEVPLTFASIAKGFEAVVATAGADVVTRQGLNALSSGLGDVYDKVGDLMNRRAVLPQASSSWPTVDDTTCDDRDPVMSPFVDAVLDMYDENPPAAGGVVYVLHAKAGQGKTFGARALLDSFYSFESESDQGGNTCNDSEAKNLRGFMLTGSDLDGDYMDSLAEELGATNVSGWVHALLLALDEPTGSPASILILDGFNSIGKDGTNLKFIKRLYGMMDDRKKIGTQNTLVLVVTHDETVANELCQLNGGQRVAPLRKCYTGEAALPIWNKMNWTRDQLIEAIRYKYPGKFAKDETFDRVQVGMTPLQAVKIADQMVRPRVKLSNPKRKGKVGCSTRVRPTLALL